MTSARHAAGLIARIGIVGALAGLAGCDDGRAATTSQSAAVVNTTAAEAVQIPGLAATLEQYREDEIQGFISVKTTNGSTSVVQFRDLRLQWSGIADNEPFVRSTQISPGVTFDVRVLQGDAVCGDPPRADGAPPAGDEFAVGNASIDGGHPLPSPSRSTTSARSCQRCTGVRARSSV